MLANWKRFVAVLIVIAVISVVELNAFFLKYLLWIPPPHPINVVRLVIWSAIGMPGLREYYSYVTDTNTKRFGTMSWLCCALAGLESLICIKFGRGEFTEPAPKKIVWSWIIFLIVLTTGATIFFTLKGRVRPSPTTPVNKRVTKEIESETGDGVVESHSKSKATKKTASGNKIKS